jgi:hypothetical protein
MIVCTLYVDPSVVLAAGKVFSYLGARSMQICQKKKKKKKNFRRRKWRVVHYCPESKERREERTKRQKKLSQNQTVFSASYCRAFSTGKRVGELRFFLLFKQKMHDCQTKKRGECL